MGFNKKAPQRSLEQLKAIAHEHGLRLTCQRLEVLRVLAAARDHPSVETVYERVRQSIPMIALDTVYRTLGMLEDVGLAKRIPGSGEEVRYDGNVTPHHHFLCRNCHAIIDIDWSEGVPPVMPPSVEQIGRVEDFQVIVRGVCQRCMSAQEKSDQFENA